MVCRMAQCHEAVPSCLSHRPRERRNLDIIEVYTETIAKPEPGKATASLGQSAIHIVQIALVLVCRDQLSCEAVDLGNRKHADEQVGTCNALALRGA